MPATVKVATASRPPLARRTRPEDVDAVDGPEPLVEASRQRVLVGLDAVPAEALELVQRGAERHGADHVGRPRLLALGRFGPDHFVEVDEVDRPAARPGRDPRSRRFAAARSSAPEPKGA